MPERKPDPDERSPLQGLGERIATARQARSRRNERRASLASMSGLGLGVRIVAEMVSALAVGVGIGLVLDRWLGTQPWMLIVFFVLGAGAAFSNLVRVAKQAEAARQRELDGAPDAGGSGQRGRRDGNGA